MNEEPKQKGCPLQAVHCWKEKCAWWDNEYEMCAIVIIATELEYSNKLKEEDSRR